MEARYPRKGGVMPEGRKFPPELREEPFCLLGSTTDLPEGGLVDGVTELYEHLIHSLLA